MCHKAGPWGPQAYRPFAVGQVFSLPHLLLALSLATFSMQPFRLRKTWKLWGHVSHSRSRACQHRKLPGCWPNTGGMHRHRISFDKDHPAYFGEAGLRCDHSKRNQSFCPIVNSDKLWILAGEPTRVNAAKKITGAAPIIDGVQSGYYKVLGQGKLPKQPVILKTGQQKSWAENPWVCVGAVSWSHVEGGPLANKCFPLKNKSKWNKTWKNVYSCSFV